MRSDLLLEGVRYHTILRVTIACNRSEGEYVWLKADGHRENHMNSLCKHSNDVMVMDEWAEPRATCECRGHVRFQPVI